MAITNKSLNYGAALMLALLLSACGGGGGGTTTPATQAPVTDTTTISDAGGTVQADSGAKLLIPAGDVSTPTTFRIAQSAEGAAEMAGVAPVSSIYELTPHGAEFELPAKLQIPYDTASVPAGSTPFLMRAEAGGGWQVIPSHSDAPGTLTGDLSGLSWYAVGVCTPDNQGFSFGAGDCPANHSLKLEYLDGNGVPFAVPRDAYGIALPFLPDITTTTDVVLRVTWTRPAGVSRDDEVYISAPSLRLVTAPAGQTVNQQVFTRDYIYTIDPSRIQYAGSANGKVVRVTATASYAADALVLGVGTRKVGWSFDADVAFRVRYTGALQANITRQPANQGVVVDQTAAFSVVASADSGSLSYKWQSKAISETDFKDIAPPATAASYTTLATALTDDGTRYRVQVTNTNAYSGATNTIYSNEAILSVVQQPAPPVFTLQPVSQSVVAGSNATLTVVATGVPAPVIEWLIGTQQGPQAAGGIPCIGSAGVTTCSYRTQVLQVADSGTQFYARAINGPGNAGLAYSNYAVITVTSNAVAPAVPANLPADITVSEGSNATFSVTATGTTPLNYQWLRNGQIMRGENRASYTLHNAKQTDSGATFSVVVGNTTGSVPSRNALLTVTPSQPPISGISDQARLSVTGGGEYGIRADGHVLALGSTFTSAGVLTSPNTIPGLDSVRELATAGTLSVDYCFIALNTSGTVYTWGPDWAGQSGCLGQGTTTTVATPTAVAGLGTITAIVGSEGGHVLALGSNGKVYAWGVNSSGQLGNNSTTQSNTPVEVTGLTNVTHVWAGGATSYALKGDGTLWAWGRNEFGQLGDGTKNASSVPLQITGIPGSIIAVAAGDRHTDILSSNGNVYFLGTYSRGVTSVAVSGANANITQATGLPAFTHLVAGAYHTLALLSNGTLYAWGSNNDGELGRSLADTGIQPAAEVPGVTGVASIAAAGGVSLAMRSDGQVMRWGKRFDGASPTGIVNEAPYDVSGFDLIP